MHIRYEGSFVLSFGLPRMEALLIGISSRGLALHGSQGGGWVGHRVLYYLLLLMAWEKGLTLKSHKHTHSHLLHTQESFSSSSLLILYTV